MLLLVIPAPQNSSVRNAMRPINQCLNSKLEEICHQAMKLEALNDIVSRYLPEAIKKHCQVGSFNKGCLLLIVNDPVWASQLRFSLPEIRDKLRSEAKLFKLTGIQIKIRSDSPALPKLSRKLHLSRNARDHIQSEADKMADGPLKRAMEKLAQ